MTALADRLRADLQGAPSADLLTGDDLDFAAGDTPSPAAVLIAVTDRPEPGVILTVRREDLRTHAGQVAFPGGRVDPGEDSIAAALRESHEELGLNPGAVAVIGALDPYRTVTNFLVTPVIGVIPPDLPLSPHEYEVADWFEAPLRFVLDPANQQQRTALFRGRDRAYYEIEWKGRKIWGATAAMIVNLAARLQWQ